MKWDTIVSPWHLVWIIPVVWAMAGGLIALVFWLVKTGWRYHR